MSNRETSHEVAAKIAKMAAASFKDHALTSLREGVPSWWHVGKPGTNVYASRLIFAPGLICIYGDVGEMALRHSGASSIGWLRGSVGNTVYLLEKVQASKDAKERFYPGDARAWCEEMAHDNPDDDRMSRLIACIDATDPLTLDDWRGLCSDAQPYIDDPPICLAPTERVLWLFESLRCFVRLFNASEYAR